MKKVKVQYVVGTEVREVEVENAHHWAWELHADTALKLQFFSYSDDKGDELIAEFANVVAVMRVDGK